MDSTTIPQFHASLKEVFSGFDPLLMAWENLDLPRLRDIENFLHKGLVRIQELVLQDKEKGYPASGFIIKIRRILDTFLIWVESLPHKILDSKSDNEKEGLLANICLLISFNWIPWLDRDYEPLAKEAQLVPNVMPIDEMREKAKISREEKRVNELRGKLFGAIIGRTPSDKERIFEILKSLVVGKGGKELALYLEAAKVMGLLTQTPTFASMQKFWGVVNSHSALSKNFGMLDDREINAKKQEIEYLLHSND